MCCSDQAQEVGLSHVALLAGLLRVCHPCRAPFRLNDIRMFRGMDIPCDQGSCTGKCRREPVLSRSAAGPHLQSLQQWFEEHRVNPGAQEFVYSQHAGPDTASKTHDVVQSVCVLALNIVAAFLSLASYRQVLTFTWPLLSAELELRPVSSHFAGDVPS